MNSTPKIDDVLDRDQEAVVGEQALVLLEPDPVERRQQLGAGERQPDRPEHAADIDDEHDERRRQQRQLAARCAGDGGCAAAAAAGIEIVAMPRLPACGRTGSAAAGPGRQRSLSRRSDGADELVDERRRRVIAGLFQNWVITSCTAPDRSGETEVGGSGPAAPGP